MQRARQRARLGRACLADDGECLAGIQAVTAYQPVCRGNGLYRGIKALGQRCQGIAGLNDVTGRHRCPFAAGDEQRLSGEDEVGFLHPVDEKQIGDGDVIEGRNRGEGLAIFDDVVWRPCRGRFRGCFRRDLGDAAVLGKGESGQPKERPEQKQEREAECDVFHGRLFYAQKRGRATRAKQPLKGPVIGRARQPCPSAVRRNWRR